jgi:hypothetical protein
MPRLVLAVMFAAAAVAKLRNSGLAWILNGTVKYHFLTDVSRAPVEWGLAVGRHPVLAVLLSAGAVLVEALILPLMVTSQFFAAIGILALLVGFWLFQGLFWPAWWILLLAFLPWRHMAGTIVRSPGRPADQPAMPTMLQRAAIVGIIALQGVVSTYKIEWPPVLSTYDMYSTTYADPQAYEAATTTERTLVATLADGTIRRCPIDSDQAAPFVASVMSDEERQRQGGIVARCFGAGTAVRSVFVEASREQIDWAAWRPLGRATVRVSTLITPGSTARAN